MQLKHLLLLSAAALFAACGDDDTATTTSELRYDGENSTSPELAAGQHELAVYFPASSLAGQVGKKLIEVEYFAGQAPQACSLFVHGPGNSNTPGSVIYEANVTNRVTGEPAWQTHILSAPIEITGDDLWIGLFVNHLETKQSIGCDAGPAKTNGNWIWNSEENAWQTFQQLVGQQPGDVNWNIRGILEE